MSGVVHYGLKRKLLGKIIIFSLMFLFTYNAGHSAELPQLTSGSLVSVITCSPASALESTFGHSALRIQDKDLGIDVVFNFGSYNSEQPFLISKTLLGKVSSSLEGEHFHSFVDRYLREGRGIKETFLNLNLADRQKIWRSLNTKLLSGKRFYTFNIFSNNCTTQLRDLLFDELNLDSVSFQKEKVGYAYRNSEKQEPLQDCWAHLFMNIYTGYKGDAIISLYQEAFHPKGFYTLFDNVDYNGKPLLGMEHELFSPVVKKELPATWLTIGCFAGLLIWAFYLSYVQYRNRKVRLSLFDRVIFMFSGILGCVLLIFVFFSELVPFQGNCNLMWAIPTNVLLAVVPQRYLNKYFFIWLIRFTLVSIVSFPIVVYCLKQMIPVEVYLFATTLFVRVYLLSMICIRNKK